MNRVTSDFVDAVRRQRLWGFLLAINVAIMVILFYNKIFNDYSENQYSFLLATYHFGFAKRAFVGSVLALFESKVHYSDLLIMGGALCLLTAALFVVMFKRTFGFGADRLQLFVFTFGSPFVFKNFIFTLGYFDIFGCLFAIIMMLLPVNALFPLLVTAGCIILLLIHHLHFLLYLPTIAFIWIVRIYCLRSFSAGDLMTTGASAVVIAGLAFALMFFGTPPVPAETMNNDMLARAADPLTLISMGAWYSTIAGEMHNTAQMWPAQLQRMPLVVLLIAAHWPLGAFMRRLIAGTSNRTHRGIAITAIAVISVAYVIICVVAYDYARWLSNWGVCMILCLHAIAMLHRASGATPPSFVAPAQEKWIDIFGFIVTALPRVGVIKVF